MSYDHVFASAIAQPFETLTTTTTKSQSAAEQRDILAFSYKLAMHDKMRQGKSSDNIALKNNSSNVSYIPRVKVNKEEIDSYLETSKEKHLTRSTWRTLDMNYKWSYINDYITTLGLEKDVTKKLTSHVYSLLKSNQLKNVEYNNKTRKIDRLGITFAHNETNSHFPVEISI